MHPLHAPAGKQLPGAVQEDRYQQFTTKTEENKRNMFFPVGFEL